jgi:hypothetical protein
MLINTKEIYGDKLSGLDGDLGHVKDFYFDDKTWVIRYLVVDTGSWMPGRLVLLTPHVFARLDQNEKTLDVKLSKKQIEDSPSIASHETVSQQFEERYYRSYGWPMYWRGGGLWGMSGYPLAASPLPRDMAVRRAHEPHADRHLQNTKAVTGYAIQAIDATIGHVTGFLVDDKNWAIRQLVVETGHWYAGKEILISLGKVRRISFEESKVFVDLDQADIEGAPESDFARAGTTLH